MHHSSVDSVALVCMYYRVRQKLFDQFPVIVGLKIDTV